jgi:hypothetical protein
MKIRKRSLVTNVCLVLIMGIVYTASFGFARPAQGLALKGCTGGSNVGLQITVTQNSDIDAYLGAMERMGVSGTFFFCEQCSKNSGDIVDVVLARGHSVGYYVCVRHDGKETDMYIGNGYSVPVMSYDSGSGMRHIGPSIDFQKLRTHEDWQQVLQDSIFGDMFIRIEADNDVIDFEKVVQIVRDKGYTILKVEEML